MEITTPYYEKSIAAEKKTGAFQLFLINCLLFQSRNVVYRFIGTLSWVNIGLATYMIYQAFDRFAIHY